jgi:hypothetical protein
VCGRTARTVRRAGRVTPFPTPIDKGWFHSGRVGRKAGVNSQETRFALRVAFTVMAGLVPAMTVTAGFIQLRRMCETAASGHGRSPNSIDCLTTRGSFVLINQIHLNTDARKGFELTSGRSRARCIWLIGINQGSNKSASVTADEGVVSVLSKGGRHRPSSPPRPTERHPDAPPRKAVAVPGLIWINTCFREQRY